jgi:hypothetical protein
MGGNCAVPQPPQQAQRRRSLGTPVRDSNLFSTLPSTHRARLHRLLKNSLAEGRRSEQLQRGPVVEKFEIRCAGGVRAGELSRGVRQRPRSRKGVRPQETDIRKPNTSGGFRPGSDAVPILASLQCLRMLTGCQIHGDSDLLQLTSEPSPSVVLCNVRLERTVRK